MAGIKPLENGKFVEIRENKNETILGQIGEVKKYNFSFYTAPEAGDYNEEFIDAFSNSSEIFNKLKGMISANNLDCGQLNIANVNIMGRFINKDNLIIEDNKIAPDVGKEVFVASKDILEKLFSNKNCNPAVLYSNRDVKAGLNPDEIITKHMAVFGTTGSGKSYFVKKMLSDYLISYILKKKKGRLIIFDPHGEYSKDLSLKNVLNHQTCFKKGYLTVYLECVEDFLEYFSIRKNSKLETLIMEIFYNNKKITDKNIVTLLQQSKDDKKGLNDVFINLVEEAIKNKKISFSSPPDIWKDFNKQDIYSINFDDVSDFDDMRLIAGNVMANIFGHAKSNKNFPTLFVVEEAHNFAPEKEGRNEASNAMIQVAREGRKFNVGMIVITQRPAYVSKDVLTQCSTQAIFRLINSNDIGQVADVVEGISKDELIRLPHYVQGQAIFTGVGINSPVVVKVE